MNILIFILALLTAVIYLVPCLITVASLIVTAVKERSGCTLFFGIVIAAGLGIYTIIPSYGLIEYLCGNQLDIELLERAYDYFIEYHVDDLFY